VQILRWIKIGVNVKSFKKYIKEEVPVIQKSMRIIMLGGPGSGKSTYSKFLTKEFLIPHVYTGDMMRDLSKQDTPTGRKVRSALDKGDYVDTKIVLSTLQKRLSRKDTERGYVLDGFPRSMKQVKEMEDRGIGYDHAVYLDVAEKEVIRRLMSRGRADDKPEIIKNRIKVYKKQTQPVIDYYKDKLITIKAKGGEQIEDIARLIIKQIKDKDESF
jgi:adenylate kinase